MVWMASEGVLVLLGINDDKKRPNGLDSVDTDVLALRVVDGLREELEELVDVVHEPRRIVVQKGIDHVRTALTRHNILLVSR